MPTPRALEDTSLKQVIPRTRSQHATNLDGCFSAYESSSPKPLTICLLGGFRLEYFDSDIPINVSGKSSSFLNLLALRYNSCLSRETILDLLWPDSSIELAAQSLNSLVYSLHRQLGQYIQGTAPVLYCEGCYRLNIHEIGVDVQAFDSLARQSEQAAAGGDCAMASAPAQKAVGLYLGDIYSENDLFATLERERLRATFLTLLARLADDEYQQGNYAGSLEVAYRLLEFDPCREDAHRMVMRCHVRRGERSAAMRQYHLCVEVLHSEFDALPEQATAQLYELVRTNPQLI